MVPDIIFVLRCDKDVLLKRLFSSELSEEDLNYKQYFITAFADKFNKCIETEIPHELKARTIILNGNSGPQSIHKQVVQHLDSYISGRL